tara:strand:- start:11 stop:247 length:237 start_codon:yes stop_codon:yes gene_type:complete
MIKNIFKVINFPIFLLSLLFGLVFIYFNDDKQKILVYPTPHNVHKIEYKDKAENCFEYNMEEIQCPSRKSDINNIPIQ